MPRSTKPATFGERLRQLRESAGLSQSQLAERAGMPPQQVSGLERGVRASPQWDTVLRLARALGCGLDDFNKGG